MNQSILQARGTVGFPQFTSERVYMRAFNPSSPLPLELSRWQPTIDAMMEGIDAEVAYLTLDQKKLIAGQTHRRAGIHIDGYWNPKLHAHSSHGGGRHTGWESCDFSTREATLLASDYGACQAWTGTWQGNPEAGGDCSHIDTSDMGSWFLTPGKCWAGNITMLHASMPVSHDVARTLVRITVPGWSPEQ